MNFNYVNTEKNKKKIYNILIVDDDNETAQNFKLILSFRGHNVYVVNDGLKCITQCKEKIFDIIFLDYHMEELDGAQVAQLVKDDKKRTLIFAYTGDSSTKAINEFKEAGMNGAIVKPIDIKNIEMLMTKLENSINLDDKTIKIIAKKTCNSIIIF